MSHNFQIFDQNVVDMLNDGDYASSAQRLNGFSGIAQETLANKCLYQLSVMCKAIAQVLSDAGETVSDATFTALVLSLKKVLQKIFVGYTSSNLTVDTANRGTLPHGLSATPTQFICKLVCLSAEFGFLAGEILDVPSSQYSNASDIRGVSVVADATNIKYQMSNSTVVFSTFDRTSGSEGNLALLTNASWALVIKACP